MASHLCRAAGKLRPLFRQRGVIALQARNLEMTRDELPGQYPETAEERARAAKKYNMRVEDYKPYPDDGLGWGDYPKLERQHVDTRSHWDDWDFPDIRRNYGDVYHIDEDIMWRNRPNWDKDFNPPFKTQVMAFFGVVAVLGTLVMFGIKYPLFWPVGKKQYPYSNLHIEYGGDPDKVPEPTVHYEF
ncbi:NADH dehydrogenase [ubiquinone] 1 beta subcomplex subunit 8, mitochondrial-like [Ptychodera flava]|uniref:NADH dehydrogenase [ubiquinone] 1 beta subcomplex subunit 8, mitochondrial-like n=1 Tax=Ptychodera flava TaxID=63121 RepID=UPI00396A6039